MSRAPKRPRLNQKKRLNTTLPIFNTKSHYKIDSDYAATTPHQIPETSADERFYIAEEEQKQKICGRKRPLRHIAHGDGQDDVAGRLRGKRRCNRETQLRDIGEVHPQIGCDGDASGSGSTAESILKTIHKIPKAVERRNQSAFRYVPFNTENEGTKPIGTEEWKEEQRNYSKQQNEAIVMLNDPYQRQGPDFGSLNNQSTLVQLYARRMEMERLIKEGRPI